MLFALWTRLILATIRFWIDVSSAFPSRVAHFAKMSLDYITNSLLKQPEVAAQDHLECFCQERESILKPWWIDMSRLFSAWDADDDGYIDGEEVAIAVNKLLRSSNRHKISLP